MNTFGNMKNSLQSYHPEAAQSPLISEAKQGQACSLLGCKKCEEHNECTLSESAEEDKKEHHENLQNNEAAENKGKGNQELDEQIQK